MPENETEEILETDNEEARKEAARKASEAKLREVKKLLLGKMIRGENGNMTAADGTASMPFGFREGAMRVMILGISHRVYPMETTFRNNTQAIYNTVKSMQNIGRIVDMETAPGAAVCYVSSPVFRPVVLILEEAGEEKQLVLRAMCGRSPLAFLAARRAVSRLEKVLPKQVKRRHRKK